MCAKVEIIKHLLFYNLTSTIIKTWPVLCHLDAYINVRNAFIEDIVQ